MKGHDLLLEWLSFRGHVSGATLNRVCKELAVKLGILENLEARERTSRARHRLLQPLHRLGHMERDVRNRWYVVPSTLVIRGNRGVLYGARSPRLKKRLERLQDVTFCSSLHLWGPERWTLEAPLERLREVGQALRFHAIPERGLELLAGLPSLEQVVEGLEPDTPPEGKWERFEVVPGRGRWYPRWVRALFSSPGLYRETSRLPALHYFFWRDTTHLVRHSEERLALRWFEAARQAELRLFYDPTEQLLVVPRLKTRLPVLLDRGLQLASGRGPQLSTRGWEYPDIEPGRAREVSRILKLPLGRDG